MAFSLRVQPFQLNNTGDNHSGLFEDISTRSLTTVRIGGDAGKINSGVGNAFVGYQSAYLANNSSYNTFVGYQSGFAGTNNMSSVYIGAFSGAHTISGNETVFIGYKSGEFSKNPIETVGVGAYSLRENVSGTGIVAVGHRSGEKSLDGGYNTFIGAESGQENRSGFYNTMGGYRSGRSSFLGDENTYFGAYSGYSNSYGSGNTFIGYRSGELLNSGDFNVAIGAYSMQSILKGSCNVSIGSFSMNEPILSSNVSINNVLIGMNVASYSTTSNSVIIGDNAASSSISIDGSIIIGKDTAQSLLYSKSNILIGNKADTYTSDTSYGIAIGSSNTLTYNNSVVIGNNVISTRDSSIILGNNLKSDGNNSIIFGENIYIKSVVIFQDILSYNTQISASKDALQKFALIPHYTNTLLSADNTQNNNAIATVLTNKLFSTGNLTNLNKINNYLLSSSLPLYYLYQGYTIPIYNNIDLYNTNNIQNIINQNYFNKIYFNDILLDSTSYLQVTSNYIPILNLISQNNTIDTSVIDKVDIIAVLNTDTYINYNISNYHSNIDIPVYFPKIASYPIFYPNYISSNLSFSTISLNNYINLFDKVYNLDLINSGVSNNLNPNPVGACNIPVHNDLSDIIIHKPTKYGTITFDNSFTLNYKPYIECSYASNDTFQYYPAYSYLDLDINNIPLITQSNYYSISSNSIIDFNINYTSNLDIYCANSIYFNENIILNSNQINTIPLSNYRYLYINSIDEKLLIQSNSYLFTSNDIALMSNEQIYLYTPENYIQYIHSTCNIINNAINSNNVFTSNLLGSINNNLLTNYVLLSNQIYNEPSINKNNALHDIIDIYNYSISLSNNFNTNFIKFNYQSNINTSNNIYNLNNSVISWSNTYYSSLTNNTNINNLYNNSSNIQNYYSKSNIYNSSINLLNLKNIYYNTSDKLILFNSTSNYNSNLLITDRIGNLYSSNIFPYYSNIYNKYTSIPRLFINNSDIINDQIQIINTSSNVNTQLNPLSISLFDTNNIINIPIYTCCNHEIWSDIPNSTHATISIPYDIQNINTMYYINNFIKPDNLFISKIPLYGISEIIDNDFVYNLLNPYISSDYINLVASNVTLNKSIDINVNITRNNSSYIKPIDMYIYPEYSQLLFTSNVYKNKSVELLKISPSNYIYNTINDNNVITYNSFSNYINSFIASDGYYIINSNINITCNSTYIDDNISLSNIYNIYNDITETFYNDITNTQYTINTNTSTIFTNYAGLYNCSNYTIYNIYNIINSNIHYLSSCNEIINTKIDTNTYYDRLYNIQMYTSNINSHYDSNIRLNYQYFDFSNNLFTSNLTKYYSLSNTCNIYNSYQSLNKNFYYSPSNIHYLTSQEDIYIIKKNIGIVNSWSNIDNVYVYANNRSTANTININNDIIPINLLYNNNLPNIISGNSYNLNIIKNKSEDFSSIINSHAPINALSIHFIYTSNSIITDNIGNIITSSLINNNYNYFNINNTEIDKISYYFTTSTGLSDIYETNLTLNYIPYTYGQDLNTGITISENIILNSALFKFSYNNLSKDNLIVSFINLNNVILKDKNFNEYLDTDIPYTNIINNNVLIYPLTIGYGNLRYILKYNDGNIHQLLGYHDYPIRIYNHNSFKLENINSSIIIQNIKGIWSNILNGNIWNINDWKILGNNIDNSKLLINIKKSPKYGFLYNKNQLNKIQNIITYTDLLNNNIIYISYDPDNIKNDLVDFNFIYNTINISPTYSNINIKNHVIRFDEIYLNIGSSFDNLRSVNAPKISQGFIDDNYIFTSNIQILNRTTDINKLIKYRDNIKNLNYGSNIEWQLSSNQHIIVNNQYVNYYNSTIPLSLNILNTNQIIINVEQSKFVYIIDLLNSINLNDNVRINDIIFYIQTNTKHGLIIYKENNLPATKITYTDLINNKIIYQHTGDTPNEYNYRDIATLYLASSPYSLSTISITLIFNIIPRSILKNNIQYSYYESKSDLLKVNKIDKQFLNIDSGYIIINNQSNINTCDILGNSKTQFQYTENIYYTLSENILNNGIIPYDRYSFDFYTTQLVNYYTNPRDLDFDITYSNLFKYQSYGYINILSNVNQISNYINNSNQIISYSVSNNYNFNYLSLQNNTYPLNVYFNVKPTFELTNKYINKYNNYYFTTGFYDSNNDPLIEFKITKNNLGISNKLFNHNISLSDNYILDSNNYNTLYFTNYDLNNNNNLSFYWSDGTNLLLNCNINSVNLDNLSNINISVPIYHESNYTGTIAENILLDDIELNIDLVNYHNTISFQNFELELYPNSNSLEDNTNNIISGRQITVRGLDNICIGNSFTTTGLNSIILGNNIGGNYGTQKSGQNLLTTINDLYESIVIGNNSFSNSIIRNIICIGNRNLNNLNLQINNNDVEKFISKFPIIIGNDITDVNIDYYINIGNTFLKTENDIQQIYLGNKKEYVMIGYTSNIYRTNSNIYTSNYDLYVNNGLLTNNIETNNIIINNNICNICYSKDYLVNDTIVTLSFSYKYYYKINKNINYIVQTYKLDDPNVFGIITDYLGYDNTLLLHKYNVSRKGYQYIWCIGNNPIYEGQLLSSYGVYIEGINNNQFLNAVYPISNNQLTNTTFAKSLTQWDPNWDNNFITNYTDIIYNTNSIVNDIIFQENSYGDFTFYYATSNITYNQVPWGNTLNNQILFYDISFESQFILSELIKPDLLYFKINNIYSLNTNENSIIGDNVLLQYVSNTLIQSVGFNVNFTIYNQNIKSKINVLLASNSIADINLYLNNTNSIYSVNNVPFIYTDNYKFSISTNDINSSNLYDIFTNSNIEYMTFSNIRDSLYNTLNYFKYENMKFSYVSVSNIDIIENIYDINYDIYYGACNIITNFIKIKCELL